MLPTRYWQDLPWTAFLALPKDTVAVLPVAAIEQHGTATRRSWRMLHLGVDGDTGRIVDPTLTSRDMDDASQVDPLLDHA